MSVWKALPGSLHTLSRFTKLIEAGEGDAAAELRGKDWSASGPRSANSFFLRLAHTWYSVILFPRFSAR